MTELRITLSERLAREAREAGLLSPQAIRTLLRQATRRKAALQSFMANAARVAAAGIAPLTETELQSEIRAARRARRSPRRAARRR